MIKLMVFVFLIALACIVVLAYMSDWTDGPTVKCCLVSLMCIAATLFLSSVFENIYKEHIESKAEDVSITEEALETEGGNAAESGVKETATVREQRAQVEAEETKEADISAKEEKIPPVLYLVPIISLLFAFKALISTCSNFELENRTEFRAHDTFSDDLKDHYTVYSEKEMRVFRKDKKAGKTEKEYKIPANFTKYVSSLRAIASDLEAASLDKHASKVKKIRKNLKAATEYAELDKKDAITVDMVSSSFAETYRRMIAETAKMCINASGLKGKEAETVLSEGLEVLSMLVRMTGEIAKRVQDSVCAESSAQMQAFKGMMELNGYGGNGEFDLSKKEKGEKK